MKRGKSKGPWMLFLFLLAGVILGSILGNVFGHFSNSKLFTESFTIGTKGMPGVLDLIVVKLAFGLTLTINFGTMLGIIIGIILFYRY